MQNIIKKMIMERVKNKMEVKYESRNAESNN